MSFQGKFKTRALDSIMLGGDVVLAAKAGSTANIHVMLYDVSGLVLLARGTGVPTNTTGGYAKGCLFIKTDATTGNTGIYENVGTTASCVFQVVGGNAAAAMSSHVVKFAGKVTWSGGGASKAQTVTGVATTDVVIASIETVPTEAAYLVSAKATLNTLTFVLSAANTTNDAVISYVVLRAV